MSAELTPTPLLADDDPEMTAFHRAVAEWNRLLPNEQIDAPHLAAIFARHRDEVAAERGGPTP